MTGQQLLDLYEQNPEDFNLITKVCRHFNDEGKFNLVYLFVKEALKSPSFVGFDPTQQVELLKIAAKASHNTKHFSECIELCNRIFACSLPSKQLASIITLKNAASEEIPQSQKKLVFVIGCGRCGTKSASVLLSLQNSTCVTHENVLCPWERNRDDLLLSLVTCLSRKQKFVGDSGFYYIPYIESILSIDASAKIICLKRDKKETVLSYMSWTGQKNHWTAKTSTYWKPGFWIDDKWDSLYPKYDLDKYAAVERYYDDYYQKVDELTGRYPNNVRTWEMNHALNTSEGNEQIICFAGIENSIIRPEIRLNTTIQAWQKLRKQSRKIITT